MFLGYMVTPEGIKPYPDKTEAILQLPSLRTIKEAQSLNGKFASLNIFISKSAEKSLPLFKTLKKCIKKSDFHWTSEAEQAFKQLKQHLSELSLLVAPKPKEDLIVYLSASYGAISTVLMTERGTVQTPVHFVLADFLAEMPDESQPDASIVETQQEPWTLFTDGSSCMDGSGAGLILTSPEGTEFTYALRFQFAASNNEAEYEALIAEKSIQEKEVTTVVEEDGPTWMTSIMEYLKEGTLPSDRKEARKLRIKARQYELLEGVLYRRSFLTPWLRCVRPLQAEYVIREIHEGSCSMLAGPRSGVAKAIRLGYYWPTMHRDVRDMIRTCNDCQIDRPVTRNPQQPLTPITAPWQFYKWEIDIAGPFPEGPGKER
nr:reverse transcriptase domain-containing protein [Tanacetum cinerariifolium]